MTWGKQTHAGAPRDAMQELTDAVVKQLELGIKPWQRPWDASKCQGPQAPFNPVTHAFYHGVNVFILGLHPLHFQTGDPRFCSYQQAQSEGWQVRRGEKSTAIFFTKRYSIKDKDDDEVTKEIRFLKHYSVFHLSQMDGPPPYRPPPINECPWRSDEATEIIMKNSGIQVKIGGDRAFYSPDFDFIQVPPTIAFKNAAEESCTRLHELSHATGHDGRLARDLAGSFGSKKYAFEEMVAETSSAFLGLTLGLPLDVPNHVNYIGHWLQILREDKMAIFRAAAQAQKAADWILNLHPAYRVIHTSAGADVGEQPIVSTSEAAPQPPHQRTCPMPHQQPIPSGRD